MMNMIRIALLAALLSAVPAYATDAPAAAPAAAAHTLPPGIAWQQGDVPGAFAKARAENKPVFLYWGAGWCPPCNQVKATIFNQQSFIERSKLFVPVYLDGDSDDAQKWGEHFKVVGYPTMILLRPDGTEITRLPGEVDAERYMQVLAIGLHATHPIKQTLEAALKGGKQLSADEWRLLADYSWDTDESKLVPADKVATTLQTLADYAPAKYASTGLRLRLKAVASAATAKSPVTIDKATALAAVDKVLADAKLARDDFDIVVNYPTDIIAYLSAAHTPERSKLAAAWNAALVKLSDDSTISTSDRLAAVTGRVALAEMDADKGTALPDSLVGDVRSRVAAADRATTNGYERHVVVVAGADALATAGLLDESDKLLLAELSHSHSPYYLMLELAANAKKRGDKAAALDWYEKAYNGSEGTATRLQWGVNYISGVIDLAPTDDARLDKAATSVLGELGSVKNAFYERNTRYLTKLVTRLGEWNKDGTHEATVKHVNSEIGAVCGKLPADDPQRPVCEGLLKPAKGSA
ncbi:MAG: thioredoxin family protein [Burkholderiales bacterium]|nr:thioredoxin family protein [Burkholderiales bacterium]